MITKTQYETFDSFFNYYNEKLFDGALNDCMIIVSQKKGIAGHFKAQAWKNKKTKNEQTVHEISLNPDLLDTTETGWQQTLVHEMAHLWQRDFGKPSRKGYHNAQWALKMEEIGLMPSSTGKPGGKKTGQKMADYPIPDGPFMKAFNDLKGKNITYVSRAFIESVNIKTKIKTASRSKTQYTCPECGLNVWGKPEIRIMCLECHKKLEQTN